MTPIPNLSNKTLIIIFKSHNKLKTLIFIFFFKILVINYKMRQFWISWFVVSNIKYEILEGYWGGPRTYTTSYFKTCPTGSSLKVESCIEDSSSSLISLFCCDVCSDVVPYSFGKF